MAGVIDAGEGARLAAAAAKLAADERKKAADLAQRELGEQKKLLAELAGLTGSFAEDWERLSRIYDRGAISLDQLTGAQADLLSKQPAIKAALDAETKARELIEKADLDAAQAHVRYTQGLIDGVDKLKADVLAQQEYVQRLGLSEIAIADLDAAKLEEQATALEGLAIKKLDRDLDYAQYGLYKAQADELRKLANLKQQGAAKGVIVEQQRKEAEEAKRIWDNFQENVQRNVGDVLYNGMDGKFEDIGSSFSQLLQRMVADALAADLMGALFPAKSTGSAGMASLINGALSLFDGGQSDLLAAQDYGDFTPVVANAKGNPFTNGVVSSPTLAPMALFGEAGEEAIMPLARSSDGSLGVRAAGGAVTVVNKVNIINQAGARIEQRPAADGGIDVLIMAMEGAMGDRLASGVGGIKDGLESRYNLRPALGV